MTLILRSDALEARRAVAAGPLSPLARSLRQDLSALVGEEIALPDEKARLTRTGGRCPRHGVLLDFDPWSPQRHRCPACGVVFEDREHHQWWVMNRQLWLAERAVHGAALAVLTDDEEAADVAARILHAAAERYLQYPNVDNVLGPTRPFFSTYLESIWSLQLAVALDLLESGRRIEPTLAGRVRSEVLGPSLELIASYDEGMSNRQVWHNAALMALGTLLDRPGIVDAAIHGRSGLLAHLTSGLLADGSWYEGENYHQFAHRGLWYGVIVAEGRGAVLPPPLVARFHEAFAVPFLTALPDFTFPARRDSQYGVSLRQWRFAEACELGLARTDDPRLLAALGRLYAADIAPGDTGRAVSTAEAERNGPAVRLDRSSLGWKSLLGARPGLPRPRAASATSVHLAHQGFAILRRTARSTFVALDYGHPGGGHGHPDRLNLWLVVGASRFLEDVGTGSYTDPTLFWYRSTWAHNAPLADGGSQPYGAGSLRAWGDDGRVGWVEASFELVPGRVRAFRRVVVLPEVVIDECWWEGLDQVEVTLPWHVPFALRTTGDLRPVHLAPGGGGAGDFIANAVATPIEGHAAFSTTTGDESLRGWVRATEPFEWIQAVVPGPPGSGTRTATFWRARGRRGGWRTVLGWTHLVQDVAWQDSATTLRTAQGEWRVETGEDGCVVTDPSGNETHLPRHAAGGLATADDAARVSAPASPAHLLVPGRPFELHLGERHYRRSEQPWAAAGAPEADVRIAATTAFVDIEVTVSKQDPVFAPRRELNPLDNENPDINSDGLQLYLELPGANAFGSWLLVPEAEPGVRVTGREARGALPLPAATWRLTPGGYQVRCRFARGAQGVGIDRHFKLNVVVNEITRGRERRRGQLVATGGEGGEWVYLRGDREDPQRMLAFEIRDA